MILYLDTSSLVKLYIREDGSDEVRRLADDARLIATAAKVALIERATATDATPQILGATLSCDQSGPPKPSQ